MACNTSTGNCYINSPPTVSLVSDAATYVSPATITLTATASDTDGTITQVAFYQGATLLGTDTTAPYNWVLGSVAAGSYSFSAIATDDGGGTGTSNTVNVTVTAPASLVSSSFAALVRSSRRGQSGFSSTQAPGSDTWANTRDSNDNVNDFGSWTSTSTLNVHNYNSGTYTTFVGTPRLFYSNVSCYQSPESCCMSFPDQCHWVQSSDPFSNPQPAYYVWSSSSDARTTNIFRINGVAGPDSFQTSVTIPSWPVLVAGPGATGAGGSSGNFATTSATPIGRTSQNDMTTRRWTMVNGTRSPSPTAPPQACTGGACDTSQNTISSSTSFDSTVLSYGTNPDSKAPYVTMNEAGCAYIYSPRAFNNGSYYSFYSPVFSVSFVDLTGTFAPFEKTTNANGVLTWMLPRLTSGSYEVRVNWPTAPSSTMSGMHYYDPNFISTISTYTYAGSGACPAAGIFGSETLGLANGNIMGRGVETQPIFTSGMVLASSNTAINTATSGVISGRILSAETAGGLDGQIVEIRDASGNAFASTTTATTGGVSGSYSFTQLAGATYLLAVVTDRKVSQTTPYISVTIADGATSTGNNITLRNVPATVKVNTSVMGSYVLVSLNGIAVGSFPPSLSLRTGNTQQIYMGAAGQDKIAQFYVTPNNIYNFTCWEPNSSGAFVKKTTTAINSGAALNPSQTYTVTCP